MSDYFNELVDQLRENHLSINPPYLHGLLTGFATTPEPDLEKLYAGLKAPALARYGETDDRKDELI